jgi:hypothetical protein
MKDRRVNAAGEIGFMWIRAQNGANPRELKEKALAETKITPWMNGNGQTYRFTTFCGVPDWKARRFSIDA